MNYSVINSQQHQHITLILTIAISYDSNFDIDFNFRKVRKLFSWLTKIKLLDQMKCFSRGCYGKKGDILHVTREPRKLHM
jgi:hypothetical protein